MGTCGDSYTEGAIALSNPIRSVTDSDRSWGKVIERKYGVNVSVYARGGQSVKDYITHAMCLPKLLSESAKELYAISLGHNDIAKMDYEQFTDEQIAAYIGTVPEDNNGFSEYPDTLIGNYCYIIDQIKGHAPNALIILLRQSRPYASMHSGSDVNEAISDIGEYYSIPVFDPELDPYMSSDLWVKTMSRNHPLFMGYAGMAEAFARLFAYYTTVYSEYFGAAFTND
jgi:hypothetical protein